MSQFTLVLQDPTRHEQHDDVRSFVGEDTSGSFGILSHHARFMTALVVGLARFQITDQSWQYLAMPGGMLYYRDNTLTITTRRFFIDTDYKRISAVLREQLLAEAAAMHSLKQSLHRMEEEVLKRLWEIGRKEL